MPASEDSSENRREEVPLFWELKEGGYYVNVALWNLIINTVAELPTEEKEDILKYSRMVEDVLGYNKEDGEEPPIKRSEVSMFIELPALKKEKEEEEEEEEKEEEKEEEPSTISSKDEW